MFELDVGLTVPTEGAEQSERSVVTNLDKAVTSQSVNGKQVFMGITNLTATFSGESSVSFLCGNNLYSPKHIVLSAIQTTILQGCT